MDENKKKKNSFTPVDPKVSFPNLEEEILKYWKDNNIFEKSVENRSDEKKWTFLDGPPFITGMPHYGTLLASFPKDVYPRFKTMQGYKVRRVWGWDCHGLPAENKVETKLGLTSKKEIETKIGVKKFIDECKLYVSEVSSEWEWYIDHIARWVDFKNAYRTMDTPYMESVMWVFKQMYEKGHIYKGLRVSLYCPHCATPISNFEVAMDADNYKEAKDPAATYKYKLKSEENTFILAWSTTPWNKIVTPALAVNPELTYIKVTQNNEFYVLAKTTLSILDGEYEIIKEFKGSELVGLEFEAHYDYYKIDSDKKSFVIIPGDFVTADEGTGVVTIAAYGEEDLKAMKEHGIHIEMHLDDEGTINSDVPKFAGMYYLKANKFVNEDLEARGLVYKIYDYAHKIPLCWRCHTRLYYAPQNAWYVDIQKIKPLLVETNKKVNWFPKHFKMGRFLKSLENAPDWNISRSRYWGSPVPVWECECGERFVPGSIKELEEASGRKITDLHKPEIDEVAVSCKKCGKDSKRVPEVLDSWIEAGSASFAERHFPFDESFKLDDFFPPDFIVEYTGQIRAWFYVLHVIGGALYEKEAFKNVAVTGVILGTDGRKMSKNYGNYPDPKELIQKYGGDALRLYLMGSPVMNGEDIIISEEQYKQQVRGMMLILWNTFNFFITYANIDGWDNAQFKKDHASINVLDAWLLSLLNQLVKDLTSDLEKYDSISAITRLQSFVTDFSTWYIRRSRSRTTSSAISAEDKFSFYNTTYQALLTLSQISAPLMPFLSESIYRTLTDEISVHLTDWPKVIDSQIDTELEKKMDLVRQLVQEGHALRKSNGWGVKDPQKDLIWDSTVDYTSLNDQADLHKIILEELNSYSVEVKGKLSFKHLDYDSIDDEFLKQQGDARRIVRSLQEERKNLGTSMDEVVDVELPQWPERFVDYIKKNASVRDVKKGDSLKVTKIG